jgi:hypothetical protein
MKRDLINDMKADMKETKAKTTKAKTTKKTDKPIAKPEKTTVLFVAITGKNRVTNYIFKDMDSLRLWFKEHVTAYHNLETFTSTTSKRQVVTADVILKKGANK